MPVWEVADSGCGIAAEDLERIFDPFFTSKFTGRGLGLAVVLGIARGYGGGITVESEPGQGSVFRVFLPVSASAIPQEPVPAIQAPKRTEGSLAARPAQSGTVLVVEDEQAVRETVTLSLKRLGFAVLAAQDGIEAVQVLAVVGHEVLRVVLKEATLHPYVVVVDEPSRVVGLRVVAGPEDREAIA